MADLKKDNEKLSREVEAKDGLADSDLSNVAGGEECTMPAALWKEMMEDAGYSVFQFFDGSDCGYYFECHPNGDPSFKEAFFPYKDKNGNEWIDFELDSE